MRKVALLEPLASSKLRRLHVHACQHHLCGVGRCEQMGNSWSGRTQRLHRRARGKPSLGMWLTLRDVSQP